MTQINNWHNSIEARQPAVTLSSLHVTAKVPQ